MTFVCSFVVVGSLGVLWLANFAGIIFVGNLVVQKKSKKAKKGCKLGNLGCAISVRI